MQSRAPVEDRHHVSRKLFKDDQGNHYWGYMAAKGGYVTGKPKDGNRGPSGWKLRRKTDHVKRNAQKAVDWPTRKKLIAAKKEAQAAVRRAKEKKRHKSNRGQ